MEGCFSHSPISGVGARAGGMGSGVACPVILIVSLVIAHVTVSGPGRNIHFGHM